MPVLPDVVDAGRRRRLAGAGLLLAAAAALAGCSRFDAALGQRQAIVSFRAGTPVSQRLAVRSTCAKVPAVTAQPLPSDINSPYALQQVTFQINHASNAEIAQLETFGDASPDLIYCAEALTYAFPDARIVQVVRDGRDVVASMLADPVVMSWYRPSFVNVDTEFPNPFFGIETTEDRDLWPRLTPAARCALRWRWSVRLAARLHHSLPSGQLKTIRYEHLLSKPEEALADLSRFAGTSVQAAEIRNEARTARARSRSRRGPAYETSLTTDDIVQIEKIAGEELRRLGYAP